MEEYDDDHAHDGPETENVSVTDLDEYDEDVKEIVYHLPPISHEQKLIVDAVQTHNVLIDAVAGSGKTTTSLQVAKSTRDKILLLTYNAKLKFDTAVRASRLGIDNIEVRSYHSYCVRHVNSECYTDAGMMKHLPASLKAATKLQKSRYQIIIVDECQDMTSLYFDVVRHAIGGGAPRLMVVGDRKQSIYQYKGSDPRYLTMAPELYNSPHKWSRLSLSTSYRITRQMAALVNEVKDVDTPRIVAVKDGKMPQYVHSDPRRLVNIIKERLKTCAPDDIFILAPSVRITNGHRLSALANALTEHRIPIYLPNSDEKAPDDSVMRGKIAFITFHQAKGLERKIVFVLSFDQSYFGMKSTVPDEFPNELYVAITRAQEELYLWHNTVPITHRNVIDWPRGIVPKTSRALPYIARGRLSQLCDLPVLTPHSDADYVRCKKTIGVSVTTMTRHIPELYSEYAMSLVNLVTVRKRSTKINVPVVTAQNGKYYEEVSEITGTASVAYYQSDTSENHDNEVRKYLQILSADGDKRIREKIPKKLPLTVPQLLRCSTLYNAIRSDLMFKTVQITDYNWVTQEQFAKMSLRLQAVTPGKNSFEVAITLSGFDQSYQYIMCPKNQKPNPIWGTNRPVTGYMDIIRENEDLFEIKTVHSLNSEHYLQLAMYLYGRRCQKIDRPAYMYNVLTDELVRMDVTDENLLKIMRVINHVKRHSDEKETDAEFLARSQSEKMAAEIIAACPKCADTFNALD